MKLKLLYSCLLAAGIMGSVFAQETVDPAMVQKIRDEGLNHSQVMNTAFYLTDVSGPRLSGSPSLKHAQEWAVSQLKSWGMANAKREPWGKFGKGWEVEKNYAAITVPYYHAIIAIPKAWTPSTKGLISSEVVILKIDSVSDFAKYKGKLKGKVVMFAVPPPTNPTAETNFTPNATRYTDSALKIMAAAQPQQGGRRGG